LRKVFHKYHRDLLNARFWQDAQQKIRDGHVEDFFPYPEEIRFSKRPPEPDLPAAG
jgi:isocitrate dehydrogenase kinase/phosphatase